MPKWSVFAATVTAIIVAWVLVSPLVDIDDGKPQPFPSLLTSVLKDLRELSMPLSREVASTNQEERWFRERICRRWIEISTPDAGWQVPEMPGCIPQGRATYTSFDDGTGAI